MNKYNVKYQNAAKRVGVMYSKNVKATSEAQAEAIVLALGDAIAIVSVTQI